MNEITNTVTLDLADFLQMHDDAEDFYTLLDAIFRGSNLGYCDGELTFSDSKVNEALRFIAPERYNERIKSLKFIKEREKED